MSFGDKTFRLRLRYEGSLRIAAQGGQLHVWLESSSEGDPGGLVNPAVVPVGWKNWKEMVWLYMAIQLTRSSNILSDR
jgi:hypothetical protein